MSLSDESAMSISQSSFSVLNDISTAFNKPKAASQPNENRTEESAKPSDTRSQASLDTCESVSERMLMTPDRFREEQEKTFARLANQSMFDSFNSEKTDMSISLNMTSSSSAVSKISESLNSPSEYSDSLSMVSKAKTTESQNTDSQNEDRYSPADINEERSENFSHDTNLSSQEEKEILSTESSLSSRNSQRERLYARWSKDEDTLKNFNSSREDLENINRYSWTECQSAKNEPSTSANNLFRQSFDLKEDNLESGEPCVTATDLPTLGNSQYSRVNRNIYYLL